MNRRSCLLSLGSAVLFPASDGGCRVVKSLALPSLRTAHLELLMPGLALRSLAALAGLALFCSGCQQAPVDVSVPVSNWPGYEYFYIAKKFGLDQAQGLRLKILQYPDPQAIVHAYLRGEVPLAQLTTVEAVDLCARAPQRCPVVVLVLDESRGGDQIAARLPIASVAQLKGKPVAVTYSTLGPYVLSRALEQQGLSLDAVTLRPMPLAEMPQALRHGDVQAAVFFPPFSDLAARDGASRRIFDSASIPGEVFDVLAVNPNYLKQHGSTIMALIRAWAAAHQEAKVKRKDAVAMAAQREGISPAEFEEAERGLVYFDLKQQADLLAANGIVSRNLAAVRRVQQRLQLLPPDSPLPAVSAQYAVVAP
ncbi:MAG: hypothetical protein RLZZ515_2118 [Cyanobacteriota bacterium]